jgi:glycosyltransferase involved in cell wall biosynthesis
MKKVIHVLFSGNVSGAENIAMKIISITENDTLGYYLSPSGTINNVLKEKKIRHLVWNDFSIFKFINFLKAIRPDVIHAHDFKASVLCSIFVWNSIIISHLHQNPPWLDRVNFKSLLYFISSFRFKSIVLVSNWKIGHYNILNKLKSKITIIPNFIDFNDILKKSNLEKAVKSYDLIFLGRLSPEKDPLRFLELIHNVSLIKSDISVALVGDGPLMNSCKEFAKNNLSKVNLDFYGYTSNPYPILKNSKAIVITSKWEGFGLVALEAASLNVRVIAASCGGLENIVNEKFGKLCRSNAEFIDEILEILLNKNQKLKNSDEIMNYLIHYGDEKKWRNSFLTLWDI